jgi:hypothetical protein
MDNMSLNISSISPEIKQNTIYKCRKTLNEIGSLTSANVSSADENARLFLRENTPARLRELAQMTCFGAEKIKSALDNKFGKNKYVLISIGRSMSSIAEAVKLLGADVREIPMSGLRRKEPDIESLSQTGINNLQQYLTSIGLTKKELSKNKRKKYVLVDYTYYGRSLNRTKNLLQNDIFLGNQKNLISMPAVELLNEDYHASGFESLFQYCRFKYFANVGKLDFNNLEQIFVQSNPDTAKEYLGNFTKFVRNLFKFNVLDSLNLKDYEDIFPQREIDAINEHFLSPKAIQNYIKREQNK